MRKYIIFILLFFSVISFGQIISLEMSYDQELIMPEDVHNSDYVGKFYSYFTYLHNHFDSTNFEIISGNGAGIFSINTLTGMLSIADSTGLNYPTIRSYTLTIKTDDSLWYDIDYLTINVKDADSCVYIKPDWGGTQSGTRNEPYNSFNDVTTFLPGYLYLQERGTTYTDAEIWISNTTGSEFKHITFAAYGVGANPIIDGSSFPTDAGFYIGESTVDSANYTDIFSYTIHSCEGIYASQINTHTRIFNCEVYSCTDNAGIYFYRPAGDKTPVYSEIYNTISRNNDVTVYHGIKAPGGMTITNCYVHDNGNHGASLAGQTTISYCLSNYNDFDGIEVTGDTTTVDNCITHNNLRGVEFTAYANDSAEYSTMSNSTSYNNGWFGMSANTGANNLTISNNHFYNNGISSIALSDAGTEKIVIEYNKIYGDTDYGIRLQSGTQLDTIRGNYIYDNDDNVGIYLYNSNYIYINNNTLRNDSIDVIGGWGDSYLINNILEGVTAGTFTMSNNYVKPNDSVFVDAAGKDFHILDIDYLVKSGTDVPNYPVDYDGDPIKNPPDIGADEFLEFYDLYIDGKKVYITIESITKQLKIYK